MLFDAPQMACGLLRLIALVYWCTGAAAGGAGGAGVHTGLVGWGWGWGRDGDGNER